MPKYFNTKNLFQYIILFELVSLLGYVFPDIRQILFFVIIFLFLILSIKDLKLGIFVILIELIIGSKGYLYYFEHDGLVISLRIAFWLIIMSIWLANSINFRIKTKACPLQLIFKQKYFQYLIVLFIFLAWGIINGLLNNNSFSNIFFDFNNWLYFTLILPIFSGIKTKDDFKILWQIFIIASSWLALKTYILLFFFSHNIPGTIEMLYGWVRNSGVGEITLIQGGFYRIFFQSHIYNLIAFIILLVLITNKSIKQNSTLYLLLTSNLSIILLSFSRSFWVGLIVAVFFYLIYVVWKISWKEMLKMAGIIILTGILSLAVITAIVKFPYPDPLGGFSTSDLLSKRAKELKNEAAVSSRWNLLPELWNEIKTAPIQGRGLGATVTYTSNDPRIVETTADQKYTTYAFEWGWLDIWLKIGLLGALAYIFYLFIIIKDNFSALTKENDLLSISIIISIISLSAVHFFTPYLNHPLGIGLIIVVTYISMNAKILKNN